MTTTIHACNNPSSNLPNPCSLRVLSHHSCLVHFNWSRVHFHEYYIIQWIEESKWARAQTSRGRKSWKMSHGQMWNCEEEDALINLESDYIISWRDFRVQTRAADDLGFLLYQDFLFPVRVPLPGAAPVVTVFHFQNCSKWTKPNEIVIFHQPLPSWTQFHRLAWWQSALNNSVF